MPLKRARGGFARLLHAISGFLAAIVTVASVYTYMLSDLPSAETRQQSALEAALDLWESERIRVGTKPKNAAKQAQRLRTLFLSRAWTACADMNRDAIVDALRELAESGRSTATTATLHSLLSTFCDFLCREGIANVNPCATIPHPRRAKGRSRRRGVRAFTADEIRRLIAAAEADESKQRPRFSVRRSVVYRILALTGARYGQVVRSLRWGDIDFDRGTITFDEADAKNGHGATLPLHPEAVATLEAWRNACTVADPSDQVFPKLVQDRVIAADMLAAGVAKKDKSGRPASFHSFRKFFASELVARGVSVKVAQQLMQHRDVKMTLEIYAEVQENGLAEGLSALRPFAQVQRTADVSGNEGKSLPATGNFSCETGGRPIVFGSATGFLSHFESSSPGGASPCRLHDQRGTPSGDLDFLPRPWLDLSGSPDLSARGGSSPPLGIQSGSEQGGPPKEPPALETLATILDLAAKMLRQAMKGLADDSSSKRPSG